MITFVESWRKFQTTLSWHWNDFQLHSLRVHMKVVSGCQYLYETLGNNFKQILNLPKHYVNKVSSEEVVPTKATLQIWVCRRGIFWVISFRLGHCSCVCVCVLVNCSCALVYPKSGIIVMENILTVSNLEAALIRRNYSLTLAFFV